MSASQAVAKPGAYRVLLVTGLDGGCGMTAFWDQLRAESGIATVNSFDATAATPTAAQLDPYDLVVTDSDCEGFGSHGAALGNKLVSYVKQGGVVVEYAFGADTDAQQDDITGAWVSDGYSPFIAGSAVDDADTLGTFNASSPLMAGVGSLAADCDTNSTLAPGATSVARWTNGDQAVAYKGQAIVVNASVEDGCSWSNGFPRMIGFPRLTLNAVKWRGRHYLSVKRAGKGKGRVKSSPAGIKCGKKCSATYNFGRTVKLSAKAKTGSKFTGWSGGVCQGKKKTCKVTMDATEHVKAKFKLST
jgi:hypothetical protein